MKHLLLCTTLFAILAASVVVAITSESCSNSDCTSGCTSLLVDYVQTGDCFSKKGEQLSFEANCTVGGNMTTNYFSGSNCSGAPIIEDSFPTGCQPSSSYTKVTCDPFVATTSAPSTPAPASDENNNSTNGNAATAVSCGAAALAAAVAALLL